MGAGLYTALRVAGIDLSALFAAGAIFAITIAFPQLDLHLDEPVVESLQGVRATA